MPFPVRVFLRVNRAFGVLKRSSQLKSVLVFHLPLDESRSGLLKWRLRSHVGERMGVLRTSQFAQGPSFEVPTLLLTPMF